MISLIAAIDSKRGIANDKGIPWDLPTDREYYRDRVHNGSVIMGMATYREMSVPINRKPQLVATRKNSKLRPGFTSVSDARKFLSETKEEIWVIGGAGLFASTIDLADELYLTLIDKDFHCTKFFPEYKSIFELAGQSESSSENGIKYQFTTWRRKR